MTNKLIYVKKVILNKHDKLVNLMFQNSDRTAVLNIQEINHSYLKVGTMIYMITESMYFKSSPFQGTFCSVSLTEKLCNSGHLLIKFEFY